jgi:hypothetical protein
VGKKKITPISPWLVTHIPRRDEQPMTQLSKKTDKIIISDMREIKSNARDIITCCNNCLQLMKLSRVDGDEWTKETKEIIKSYNQIRIIMEEKRGRF